MSKTAATTEQKEPAGLVLPTEKTTPELDIVTSKFWIYGEPGIGKTTFGTSMADDALLLAADPGYRHLSVLPVDIDSWQKLRETYTALKNTDAHKVLVVDRVEQLYDMCLTHTMQEMGRTHPSDQEDFGQGWQAVNAAFQATIGALCALGRGVVFLSHEKRETGKGFQAVDKVFPATGGSATKFLGGFVDFIFYLQAGPEGHRILRTVNEPHTMAKQRVPAGKDPLPDEIPAPTDDPAGPLRDELAKWGESA